jgi:hypothetical protein
MKLNIKTILFILILLSSNIFAQETAASSASYAPIPEYKKMYAGFLVGGGLSVSSKSLFISGKKVIQPSFGVSGVFQYYFLKNIGFAVDLGYNYFSVKEDDNAGNISSFNMHTIIISIMPVFTFKGIYFGVGMFFDFPVSGKYKGVYNLSSGLSNFTTPNVGLHFRMGYTFKVSGDKLVFAGVDVKSQTGDFYKDNKRSGRVFAVHIVSGLLFGIK